MKPVVIVFDLDNTLMDHSSSSRNALRTWIEGRGHALTDELATTWAASEANHFTEWKNGQISFAEQRRRRLRDVLPLLGEQVGSDEELDGIFVSYLASYEANWQAYPDVIPCLEELRAQGRRLAVLTNGSEKQQLQKLDRIGVAEYFEAVFTAEGLGVGKPAREAYTKTASALGVLPHECLNVGDDYEMDVMGPRAAGWCAIHLDRVGQRREAYAIASLAGLSVNGTTGLFGENGGLTPPA